MLIADTRQDIFLHKTNLKVTPPSSQAQTMPLWRSVWERRSFKPLWGRSRDLRQSGRNSASCKFFFFCQKELGSADSKWVLKENDRLGMCGAKKIYGSNQLHPNQDDDEDNRDDVDVEVLFFYRSIPSQGNTAEVTLTVFHRNFLGVCCHFNILINLNLPTHSI